MGPKLKDMKNRSKGKRKISNTKYRHEGNYSEWRERKEISCELSYRISNFNVKIVIYENIFNESFIYVISSHTLCPQESDYRS
jgi:hypothetical protein